MRRIHGIDEPEHDRRMLRKIRAWEIVFLLLITVFIFLLVWILAGGKLKDYWLNAACAAGLIAAAFLGFRYVSWEGGSYLVTDEYLQTRSLFGTRAIPWEEITGYGVYGVLGNDHKPLPYIVLFRTEERYVFPLPVGQCFDPRRKMIALRYTEERFREIAGPLEKRGIPLEYRVVACEPDVAETVNRTRETEASAETCPWRMVHGTDEEKLDTHMRWYNRCGSILILLLMALVIALAVFLVREGEAVFGVVVSVFFLVFLTFGLYFQTERNILYRVTDTHLLRRSALGKERFSWDRMTGYGVYTVPFSIRGRMPRPYIILWRTRERFSGSAMLSVEQSIFHEHEDQMIVLRYTEERLREIAEQMEKRGIPLEHSELSDYL